MQMAKSTKTPSEKLTRADLRVATQGAAPLADPSTMAGFIDKTGFELPEGAVIKSRSPMVPPKLFPVGKVLVGRFAKMFQTEPQKGKMGVGIEIIPYGSQIGIAVPAVATIAQGLEITGADKGLEGAKTPYLGRTIALQRMEGKLKSKKGQDAWHFIVAIYPENSAKS